MTTLGATPSTTTFPATAADVGADAAGAAATAASGAASALSAHEADTTSVHGIANTADLLTNPMTTAADLIVGGASGVPARLAKGSDGQVLTVDPTTHLLVWATSASGGAPTTVDYLVGTADGGLSNEIVVGSSPGGELGGTWASPTVDATHSGSSHAGLSGQPGSTDVAVADGGTGSSTAANARTALGLVIGTDVRAQGSGDPTRASLGLATSDSPEFAALNVGAAADTTISRTGAGDVAVEGNALYRAGGTDVPIADGGTGAGTAADARTNLGLGAAALLPNLYLPYRTGGTFYYGPPMGAGSSLALIQNTLYAIPYPVPVATTFASIAVMTAAGVASSTAQLGIYSDSAGVPGALVLDAGNVATATGGYKAIAISQALSAGIYWLACAVQGAAGNLWCNSAGDYGRGMGTTSPFTAAVYNGYTQTGITGALPSPWGATKTETARLPGIWIAPA